MANLLRDSLLKKGGGEFMPKAINKFSIRKMAEDEKKFDGSDSAEFLSIKKLGEACKKAFPIWSGVHLDGLMEK